MATETTIEQMTTPPFPEKMSFREMYDGLFNRDFLSQEEFRTICDAAEMYANGCIREYKSKQPSSSVVWDELRDKFFTECTTYGYKNEISPSVNIAPHDLFEWFKKELASHPTPVPRWNEIKKGDNSTLPKDEEEYIFDGGENGITWARVKRNGKHASLMVVDSSGEEEYYPVSDYYRWLDETPAPIQDELKILKRNISKCIGSINGVLDGIELDNTADVIENSYVIKELKSLLDILENNGSNA